MLPPRVDGSSLDRVLTSHPSPRVSPDPFNLTTVQLQRLTRRTWQQLFILLLPPKNSIGFSRIDLEAENRTSWKISFCSFLFPSIEQKMYLKLQREQKNCSVVLVPDSGKNGSGSSKLSSFLRRVLRRRFRWCSRRHSRWRRRRLFSTSRQRPV